MSHPLDTATGFYRYKGFDITPSVQIRRVMLPGAKDYDGGLPGISYLWLKKRDRTTWFFPCRSLEEFFAYYLFSNLEKCAKV